MTKGLFSVDACVYVAFYVVLCAFSPFTVDTFWLHVYPCHVTKKSHDQPSSISENAKAVITYNWEF